MECSRRFFGSIVFLAMIFFTGKICAQENPAESEESQNYHIEMGKRKKPKFMQKLSWSKVEYIDNYKITVQKKEDENFRTVYEDETTETEIEVSLEPGEYQFQISVVDFFEREIKSPWRSFEVLQAFDPKIKSVYPKTLMLGEVGETAIFTIAGENFFEGVVFKLKRIGEDEEVLGRVLSISEGDGIKTTATVQFDTMELESNSSYNLFVVNPGGLSDVYGKIQIKEDEKKSPPTFKNGIVCIGVGYTFPVMFYDKTLETYAKRKFYPISALAKISVLPLQTKFGSFGFSIGGTYSMLKADTTNYKIDGHCINALFNLVYKNFIIPERLSFDLHGGAGVGMLLGMQFKYTEFDFSSPKFNAMGISFGGGFAVQFFPVKHFYIEAGADFVHMKFKDMNVGTLYPSVSIGGMF